jgi:DNA gyrase subunit A
MLINTSGVAIRLNAENISVTGRNTMGVTLMKTTEEEKVVAIAKINKDESVEAIEEEQED